MSSAVSSSPSSSTGAGSGASRWGAGAATTAPSEVISPTAGKLEEEGLPGLTDPLGAGLPVPMGAAGPCLAGETLWAQPMLHTPRTR
jgi:hypothetical protein